MTFQLIHLLPLFLPTPVGRALGISPLVAVAQTARAHQPSRLTQAHLPPPPAKEGASDPLTTPIAPRRLAAAINNDFGPHVSILSL